MRRAWSLLAVVLLTAPIAAAQVAFDRILAADRERRALRKLGRSGDKGRRRADGRLRPSEAAGGDAIPNRRDFGQRGLQAVHLPVTGDERARAGGHGRGSVKQRWSAPK